MEVKDCDLFIHEATFGDDLADETLSRNHSTASQALETAAQCNVRFVILHISANDIQNSLRFRRSMIMFHLLLIILVFVLKKLLKFVAFVLLSLTKLSRLTNQTTKMFFIEKTKK
jgi:hypothetical protein